MPPRKAQPAQPTQKTTAIRQKMSKAQILSHLAAQTGLTRNQVDSVFEERGLIIL